MYNKVEDKMSAFCPHH